MKFKELWRASLRDLKANPRKIAILGLLAATALYFWVPLAKKLLSRPPAQEFNPQSMLAQLPGTGASSPTAAKTAAQDSPWNVVVETIEGHPLTKPLATLELAHDPFAPAPPQEKTPEVKPPTAVELAAQEAEALDQLGLKLTATSIGAFSRAATINDRAYRPGDTIEDADGKAWKLVEIGPRHVVLLREGRTVTLEAPRTLRDELRDRQAKTQNTK